MKTMIVIFLHTAGVRSRICWTNQMLVQQKICLDRVLLMTEDQERGYNLAERGLFNICFNMFKSIYLP